MTNIFYLTAMDVETWVGTERVSYCAGQKLKKGFSRILEDFGDKVPGLDRHKNASYNDVERAMRDAQNLKETPGIDPETVATVDKLIKELAKVKPFMLKSGVEVDAPQDLITASYAQLDNVFDDKLSQYHFIPYMAYASTSDKGDPQKYDSLHFNGLIVNLADVNYWDKDLVKKIEDEKLDYKSLMDDDRKAEIEVYNKMFFLETDGDKIFPELEIKSPFIERLIQVYTSLFARIGVDFDKEIAKEHWKTAKAENFCRKNTGGAQ